MTTPISLLTDPVVALATSLGLALLLAGAALHKWPTQRFATILASYDILPSRLIAPASVVIPLGEMALALGLLNPATRQIAAPLVAALLLGYAAVMAVTLARGRRVADCGCSLGRASQGVSSALVWRNLVLALLASNLVQSTAARGLSLFDWISIVGAVLIGALFYVVANTLIATHQSTRELFHD